jgi:hypothetical protein
MTRLELMKAYLSEEHYNNFLEDIVVNCPGALTHMDHYPYFGDETSLLSFGLIASLIHISDHPNAKNDCTKLFTLIKRGLYEKNEWYNKYISG